MVSFGSLLVFTFSTFLKPLSTAFGWSRESVSASFGFAALTVAVCSPFLGRLLDRHPTRRIIVPCMAIFGLSFASLGFLTPSLLHLYAIFVVMGVVGNGSTQMGYSRATGVWPCRSSWRGPPAARSSFPRWPRPSSIRTNGEPFRISGVY